MQNTLLKNFVFFLNEIYYNKLNLKENLFELLKNLYKEDIKHLINQNIYPVLQPIFFFQDIDKLLQDNQDYNSLKKNFVSFKNKKEIFYKKIFKMYFNSDYELNKYMTFLSLKKYDYPDICFNTITILIDGFTTEYKNELRQWGKLIEVIKDDTIIYFYRWPSGHLSITNPINPINYFLNSKERAKSCGKLLAQILLSKKFFNGYQINLVGFSLGNHVIKHCLKELNKIDNDIKLKKVIMIAGATQITRENTWKKIIEKTIVDKFINCYSKNDTILKTYYTIATSKNNPIGLNELIIKNDNGINLIWNYEFNFDHTYYDYEIVANKIFGQYKDI